MRLTGKPWRTFDAVGAGVIPGAGYALEIQIHQNTPWSAWVRAVAGRCELVEIG
jgi:hypothetical protein